MKKNKFFYILAAIFATTSLSGCYDSREIDETAYIVALGIDSENQKSYNYTFQLANPLEMSGGGAENESGGSPDSSVQNFVVSAPDFYIAKNQLNNFLSKTIDMSHLKLIVFSKTLDDDGFLNHSQFLIHEREVRPHTLVAVASESAGDFIKKVKPTLEANTAKYYELMSIRSDNIYAPSTNISDFLDQISINNRTSVLPIAHSSAESSGEAHNPDELWVGTDSARIDSKNSCLRGMAVFKNGEICGYMNGDCAMIFNILNRKIKSCTITLKNPAPGNSNLVFRVNIPKSAGYKIEKSKNKYLITVSQNLDIKFIGEFLPEGFNSEDELYNFAKQTISQKFTDFLYDLSRGKRADIMNMGNHFKKLFADTTKWDPTLWQKIFESADFSVNL
ncbi:MAG: Ger(x)C family spore germination protein [Clostridia bacterium]|nr:Ger(x)C family spore germination protein [Clostridia bacterium]